jgi:hypothetical protein
MVPMRGSAFLVMRKTTLVLMGSLLPLFTAATLMGQGTCPSNVPAGVTKCYFIDYAVGSDANNGTTESTPWQHAPGFANATGTVAAHTPSAGEGWIFKGGVTVDYHAWPAFVPYGGTASNPTYVGVDRAWYTGGSWTRPIFSGGGASGYHADTAGLISDSAHHTSHFIIDSIEFTGLYWNTSCGGDGSTACSYLSTWSAQGDTNWEAKNLYVHGWNHGASNTQTPGSLQYLIELGINATQASESSFHDSVIDGSDSSKDCCAGAGAFHIYNNYFSYLTNFIYLPVQNANYRLLVHDNTMVHNASQQGVVNGGSTSDAHPNCFHSWGAQVGYEFIYNNLMQCQYDVQSYASQIMLLEHDGATGIYVFNNVIASAGNAQGINPSNFTQPAGSAAASTFYIFNNTIEAELDPTPGASCYSLSYKSITTLADNFCITNNNLSGAVSPSLGFIYSYIGSYTAPSPAFSINCGSGGLHSNFGATQICAPIGSGNGTGNLNASQTYPFAPMDSTAAAKVSTGQNNTAYCTAISVINAAAGTACLSDTTVGVSYNAAKHTVTWPNRTPMARPTGTANWTNGAYEPGTGNSASVNPPSGLTATVN